MVQNAIEKNRIALATRSALLLVAPLILALASGVAIALLAIAVDAALLVLLTVAVLPGAAALLTTGALLTGSWVALIRFRHDWLLSNRPS